MKKIINFAKDNIRQIFEIVGLIVVILLPWTIDLQELFKQYIEQNYLKPENIWSYIALTSGRLVASVILFVILLGIIRKTNADVVMNRRYNPYHDYCYAWYWFCARILGIKSCNLVNVPIYMQIKLIIRGTFYNYPLQDEDYPIVEPEPECCVSKTHGNKDKMIINIILEDTFPIEEKQLNKSTRELYTIKISRYNGSNDRHFSNKFVEETEKVIKEFKRIDTVNLFATTNPKNTVHIARRVFGSVDRGNIGHLFVFQQNKDGIRMFESKGHKVY